MATRIARVLCVDSSELRLQNLKRTLEKAGFEAWTAWGASDAVCLASSVPFDALIADQTSYCKRADIWECLAQSHPRLPILVHEGKARAVGLCGEWESRTVPRNVNPEALLAMLVLLLGQEHKAVTFQRGAAA
jgi:DNA-binding NtrC family response regulator